jgi:glycosyltransferase involved in cell wall biosynthesis/peptidoglycan/xylan/chitin deacetylase (PgdA/CDA1 family)
MPVLQASVKAAADASLGLVPIPLLARMCSPVLTYHACFEVLPGDVSNLDNIQPAELYEQVSEMKRHFQFVSIDELVESRTQHGLASVTFDDGYKSVIEVALPVLRSLNIPFTVFLTTHPFDGKVFWRHKVTHLVNHGLDRECALSFQTTQPVAGESFYTYLKNPLNNSATAEREIDAFLERKGIELPGTSHLIDAEKYLVEDRLLAYGNHTYSHYVLSSLSAEEQRQEIGRVKAFLEARRYLRTSSVFAAPFGGAQDINRATLEAARDLGYRAVLLNRSHVNPGQIRAVAGIKIIERFSPGPGAIAQQVRKNAVRTVLGRSPQQLWKSAETEPQLRVLEFIDSLDTGGAERVVAQLSLEMSARGHEVHIMCLRELGETVLPRERFADAGVRLSELLKPEGFKPALIRQIADYVRENGIDLVHSHNPLVCHYAVAAAKLGGAKASVNTVHGVQTLGLPLWAKALYGMSCWGSDRVVCVSQMVKTEFDRKIPAKKGLATVIANGIDVEALLEVERKPSAGEFVIGTIGRFVPVKGHRFLLDAFARIADRYPNCRLAFLGYGELDSELQEQCERLGLRSKTTFRGWSRDVAGYLSGIDLFVLPSLSEGLPLTLLEAMAAGVPAVASAVGGIPEVIERSGAGWLCPPGDILALAGAICSAMDAPDLRQKGLAGRADVLRFHSAGQMANRYLELFESLVNGSGSR